MLSTLPWPIEALFKIVREEMRHFEMVLEIMSERGIAYHALSSSRYAKTLYAMIRSEEPDRFLDLCLVGAIIESRSCERFHALSETLDDPILKTFYGKLYHAEKRHFIGYLEMALEVCDLQAMQQRWQEIAKKESESITSHESLFRFHSGDPGPVL